MKIVIVHNEVSVHGAPDEKDVLLQVEAVAAALVSSGHEVIRLGCTLDLEDMKEKLLQLGPQLVFNLVESLGGYGSLIHLFPFLLEAMGLPYSGSAAEAVRLTSNKTAAKKQMREAGLPTPDWVELHAAEKLRKKEKSGGKSRTWIIKSLWEHASLGLDRNSLVQTGSAAALIAEMKKRAFSLGGVCFAEEFIPGREFNLSILAGDERPRVLPPAEICFDGFDPVQPRIVDYRAKWEEDSFEYRNTPRCFDFSDRDSSLIAELQDIALRCWEIFGLRGYARVDFRVDGNSRPWILEVNANPCLSPDAGFAAALIRARIPFSEAVGSIIADSGCSRWNCRMEGDAMSKGLRINAKISSF
jgi:D-alanine-D-alanine ligase